MGIDTTSITVPQYLDGASEVDTLPFGDPIPATRALFRAVGKLMSVADDRSSPSVRDKAALVDALGDVFWYAAALGRRLNADFITSIKTCARIDCADQGDPILALGRAAGDLLSNELNNENSFHLFMLAYFRALASARLSLSEIMAQNLRKSRGYFSKPDPTQLPTFDSDFDNDEQLPRHFEIEISERRRGQAFMKWNGVFIGDPLTDNRHDSDGYRFHDVFHYAHAAVLHWSPAFRGLIMHKRKTDDETDEVEDGGRAIVVEEGLTNWLFGRAKKFDFFEGYGTVPYELLKTVRDFVRGYEVEQCPLKLWEDAILQGYAAFRQVSKYKRGLVIGDRTARTLKYRRLE